MNAVLITCYLFAIVIANNVISLMGPTGLFITGFFLIPFDLVSRDALHDNWREKRLIKMVCLIIGGSALSYFTNPASKQIAIASAFSFTLAGIIDYIVYSILENKSKIVKMNSSNLFSSLVDSVFFQIIAFGSFSYSIAGTQTAIKFIGAAIWSLLLVKLIDKLTAK